MGMRRTRHDIVVNKEGSHYPWIRCSQFSTSPGAIKMYTDAAFIFDRTLGDHLCPRAACAIRFTL